MMHLSSCFAVLLLAVALAQAGPAAKVAEKKTLVEDAKVESNKTDLKIEETGKEKDRAKKSAATFCVEIKPGSSQPTQVPCKNSQAAAQSVPMTIQSEPIPQQIQTVSMLQPVVQMVPQASIVMPQPMVQPVNTLQIVQPAAQPCVQSIPSVNIIQSVPQSNVVQPMSKPKPKPKPTPVPAVEVKTTTETPKPMRIEQVPQPLPETQETLAMLPVAPPCHDHIITIPSSPVVVVPQPDQSQIATVVQVPSVSPCGNPLHGVLSPCTCQVMSESYMEPMKMLPIVSYASSFAKSPMTMQDHMENLGPQARTHTHVNVNYHTPHHHDHQKLYQKVYLQAPESVPINTYNTRGLIDDAYAKALTINAYPQSFASATAMAGPNQVSMRHQETASNKPVAFEAKREDQSSNTSNRNELQ